MELTVWHWLGAGIVCLIAELFAAGAFFLGMGISAIVVAGMLWVDPSIDWKVQVTVFGVIAIISILIGRRYMKSRPIESDRPLLNERGRQYVGRLFTLEEPIKDGRGRVRVDDSTWKISGPDMEAGRQIKVVDTDGVVLMVEASGQSE